MGLAESAAGGVPVVAFNPGIRLDLLVLSDEQDYTAGEIGEEFPECQGRWIHGVQWHILSYLGEWWAQGPRRFTNDFVIGYTSQAIENGEVVTWDVPPQPNGLIPEEFAQQLEALGKVLSQH